MAVGRLLGGGLSIVVPDRDNPGGAGMTSTIFCFRKRAFRTGAGLHAVPPSSENHATALFSPSLPTATSVVPSASTASSSMVRPLKQAASGAKGGRRPSCLTRSRKQAGQDGHRPTPAAAVRRLKDPDDLVVESVARPDGRDGSGPRPLAVVLMIGDIQTFRADPPARARIGKPKFIDAGASAPTTIQNDIPR
jgi:hypothetical protein